VTERRDDAEEREGPVIRDKRRIDPKTGQVRESAEPAPGSTPNAPPAADNDETADLRKQLAERTLDLQRLQAEYSNYRKRVERDRVIVREQALANVLSELLPVLDDIGRARQHGELEGGFKSVGEALEAMTSKLGLVQFGAEGDPFDPTLHEALTHTHSADVTESTAVAIYSPGYRLGERVLRPARVGVADPADEVAADDEAVAAEDSAE
jgi:molecular chaperone GrpE